MKHIMFLACWFSSGVLLEKIVVVGAIGSERRRFIRHLAKCNCKDYTDDICKGYYEGVGSSFLPDDYKECAPICCIRCDCQKITEQTCKECLDEGKCASEELYACAKKCCVPSTPKPTKKPHPHRYPTKAPERYPTKAPHPNKEKPTPEPSSKPHSSRSGSSKGSRTGGRIKGGGGKGMKAAKNTSSKHGKEVREKKHSAKKKTPQKNEIIEHLSEDDFPNNYGSYMYHEKHSHGSHYWRSEDNSQSKGRDDDSDTSSNEDPRDSGLSANGTVEIPIPTNSTWNGTVVNDTNLVAPASAPVIRVNISAPASIPTVNVTANITQSNATSTTIVVTRAGPTTYEILLNNTKSSNSSNSANSSNNRRLNMALIFGIVGISLAGIAAVFVTSRRVRALPTCRMQNGVGRESRH
jgi:hypothetical protein